MGEYQPTDRFERHWRWARWVLLCLAITLQGLHVCYFGNIHLGFFNPDKAVQIAAARGLLDGHGLTATEANRADASEPIRHPLVQWPMGYSVLFAALWPLLGDLWNTSLAIEILGAVLFFTAWLAILEWQGAWVDARAKLVVMCFWALAWNPLNVLTCTEMIALGLLCWGVAFCLAAAAERHALAWSAAAAVCAALTAWFRYAYWPLTVIMPATLAVTFWFSPNRRRMAAAAALNAGLTGLLVLGVIVLQRCCTGHTTSLTAVRERSFDGYSWGNLLWTCPFPSAAIGFPDLWPFVVKQVRWLAALPESKVDWAFSIAVVVAAAWWGTAALLRFRRNSSAPRADTNPPRRVDGAVLATLIAAGVITTAATIGSMELIAIRTPLDGDYTYVVERRYFAALYPFAGLALACACVDLFRRRGGRWSVAPKCVVAVLVVAWFGFGVAWRANTLASHYCDKHLSRSARRACRLDCRLVEAAVRRHLDVGRQTLFVHPIGGEWYCSHGELREPILALMAGACHVSYEMMRQIQLPVGKSVALLAVVPDEGKPCAAEAARFLAQRGGFVRSVRLRDGWLYESVWNADRTAAVCPPQTSPRNVAGL